MIDRSARLQRYGGDARGGAGDGTTTGKRGRVRFRARRTQSKYEPG